MHLYVQKAFVCIHNLFKADRGVRNGNERPAGVELLVELYSLLLGLHNLSVGAFKAPPFCIYACKYASGKVASHRHKIYLVRLLNSAEPLYCAVNLAQMLVGKGLIDGDIVAPVAEVAGLCQFLAGAGRACNGRNVHIVNNAAA